ncbi:MAG TPA: EF-hand domain-containing protein [Gemmataceae bacterium]
MSRFLVASLAMLAIVTAGWVVAQDQKKPKPEVDKAAADEQKPRKIVKDETVEKFIKAHDKDKDGFLSKDELPEKYQDAFDEIDANKDGKLSKQELIDGWHLLHSHHRPSDFIYVMIEMSDNDEECVKELQSIYSTLRKLDRDKDGKLNVGDLQVAREKIFADRVEYIFKHMDKNKSGKISKDEALGEVKIHFDEIDVNKDGFIDREELLKAISAKPKPDKEEKKDDK